MKRPIALFALGLGLLTGCPEHSAPTLSLRSPQSPGALADEEPRPPPRQRELSQGRSIVPPRPR